MKQHHWSGWSGAYCLDCGCEDPREMMLADGFDLDEIPCEEGVCEGDAHPDECGQCRIEGRR